MLSSHQLEIANEILRSTDFSLTLAGLAGTGKTTLVKYLYDKWSQAGHHVAVLAPTGKAASVLISKMVPASTVHSAIYHFKGMFENDRGEREPIFKDNRNGRFCDRIIVDEASMITQKQRADIESRGIQTLWVGDPGQLQPVKSGPNGLFTKPKFILREIHRQAQDNPIILWAYALRKGTDIRAEFPGITHIKVGREHGARFIAREAARRGIDRLICKTNEQRVALNDAVREQRGFSGTICLADEIICCHNNWKLGVVNGETFDVMGSRKIGDRLYTLVRSQLSGVEDSLDIWPDQFGIKDKLDYEKVPAHTMVADYAYAVTCHKFQGSSAPHVGIIANGWCGDSVKEWNYTAATRAEVDVTVFC